MQAKRIGNFNERHCDGLTSAPGRTPDLGLEKSASNESNPAACWSVRRIDVRSPVTRGSWPVARLELEHPDRGRVTDISHAEGAFDALFSAASHIVGVAPRLLGYNVYSLGRDSDDVLRIRVDIDLHVNGANVSASCTGVDLVRCSIEAWLDAVVTANSLERSSACAAAFASAGGPDGPRSTNE